MRVQVACDSSQGEIVNGQIRMKCGGPSVADGFGCGALSEFAPIVSPAAPALTRMEQLEKRGWSDDSGSFTGMALGLSVLCPDCTTRAKAARRST